MESVQDITEFRPGAIPRWITEPRDGTDEHVVAVPGELPGAARRLAVPQHVLVLTAHAKVLALLTGENRVTTGYMRAHGELAQFGLPVGDDSWRQLVTAVHAAEQQMADQDDLSEALPETVFVPTGDEPWIESLPPGSVLAVRFEPESGTLRLRYRTDAIDSGYAARIAGYYQVALAMIIADPGAGHRQQNLLSGQELAYQLDEVAGPHRQRPDQRFHELFEQRVRLHPDRIAAVHNGRQLTYQELNRRANRIARAILAKGVGAEDVVAVVTERDLNWMAAVIAVFKAGAVYLPIEPHFPSDRIATMISRAGCRLALTEAGVAAVLPRTGLEFLLVESLAESHAGDCADCHAYDDTDPHVPVGPDQLAYIYFTSGSTGEPKGAMCEHAGMLNHLYAKVEDVGISAGDVVAQIAPQCFDISLWQLVCALLVGGRTVIVAQEEILDVEKCVSRIAAEAVTVLQVVPSYLDVLLSHVERSPGGLDGLRSMLVTGEEIKKDLVRRWFSVRPGVKLVNAYGLTETSDDTNHEVMDRVPQDSRIPLGRLIANVRAYVVDEDLRLVPLGATGELVFSGVCVGRGYVNDPERTRQAFGSDPYHPGQRLYRTGDRGRWLPGGKLEYLGRVDTQIKIRGFRVELGEVESKLQGLPDVHSCAVVAAERADGSRHLAAFYLAGAPLPVDHLRARLGQVLPEYMIPAAFHWRTSLPLTANGKVSRKALTRLAARVDPGPAGHVATATPAQHRLAAAWSTVLDIPVDQIGQADHFFERGGTSLAAVRMAIALDRLLSPKDMIQFPVLADMATLLEERSQERRP